MIPVPTRQLRRMSRKAVEKYTRRFGNRSANSVAQMMNCPENEVVFDGKVVRREEREQQAAMFRAGVKKQAKAGAELAAKTVLVVRKIADPRNPQKLRGFPCRYHTASMAETGSLSRRP